MKNEMKFEEALGRLQEIAADLEKGETSLDDSIKLFEEGARISALCYDKLDKATQKISKLENIDTGGGNKNV